MSGVIFTTALGAVLPIVLMILLGYVLRCVGFFSDEFLAVGSRLVFRVCLPVMLFLSVYSVGGLEEIRWDICLYCVAAVMVIFLLGVVTALAVTKEPGRRGVLLQCTFRSNYAIVGMPLAAALGGEGATAVAAVLAAVVVVQFNTLAVVALSVFRKEGGQGISAKKIAGDIVKNPLIIGVAVGLAALLVRQWQLSRFGAVVFSLERDVPILFKTLGDIRAVTSPFALLVLGGQFRFSAVGGLWKEIVTGTLWRTVLAPVIGLGGAVLLSRWGILNCDAGCYAPMIAVFGSPVAMSSAIMAREMKNDEQLAVQLLVWTSLASTLTIFLIACVMMGTGLLNV